MKDWRLGNWVPTAVVPHKGAGGQRKAWLVILPAQPALHTPYKSPWQGGSHHDFPEAHQQPDAAFSCSANLGYNNNVAPKNFGPVGVLGRGGDYRGESALDDQMNAYLDIQMTG